MSGESRRGSGRGGSFRGEVAAACCSCDVVLWDERLTTTAANRALRDAGKKTRATRGVVDQVAAQMILQGYLDSRQIRAGLPCVG